MHSLATNGQLLHNTVKYMVFGGHCLFKNIGTPRRTCASWDTCHNCAAWYNNCKLRVQCYTLPSPLPSPCNSSREKNCISWKMTHLSLIGWLKECSEKSCKSLLTRIFVVQLKRNILQKVENDSWSIRPVYGRSWVWFPSGTDTSMGMTNDTATRPGSYKHFFMLWCKTAYWRIMNCHMCDPQVWFLLTAISVTL